MQGKAAGATEAPAAATLPLLLSPADAFAAALTEFFALLERLEFAMAAHAAPSHAHASSSALYHLHV